MNGLSSSQIPVISMSIKLIVDSGSTKAEWCLMDGKTTKKILTQGLSPYFFSAVQIENIILQELRKKIPDIEPDEVYFYGTGCSNIENANLIKRILRRIFKRAKVIVDHDLMGAARALCGKEKGIVCILGTGSNSCFYNGKKIVKNNPGLGYVLGDEGSGAYLGKKVIQYFLYRTFDADLMERFHAAFHTNSNEILSAVYKKPLPNRYLASYAVFLSDNRGHYMIENILEDGINDFFFNHISKYRESWTMPIHFVGSIASVFKDVLQNICNMYELQLGKVMKKPMEGLVKFHG